MSMSYYEEIEFSVIEAYSYHKNQHRIFLKEMAALEAIDATTNTGTTGASAEDKKEINEVSTITKVTETAKKILDELMKWLEKFLDKLINKVKEIIKSHQGFKNEFARYRTKYEPTDTISVTIYQYNTQYLANVQNTFESFINSILNNVNTTNSTAIINQDPTRINEEVIKKLQLNDVDNVNQIYSKLKEKFRGEKKKVVLKADTDLAKYEERCLNFSAMESLMNGNIQKIRTKINTAKRKFSDMSRADSSNKESYRRKMNNLSYIMKLYSNMIANFTILNSEYLFTCREICRRFYKMPTTT